MAAATQDIDTPELSGDLRSFGVAAATTIYAGSLVAMNASGYLVPASASTALKLVGRAEKKVVNTVAAGFGSNGDLNCTVKKGTFYFLPSGSITIADRGKLVYAVDDTSVSLTDGAGLRPAAGRLEALETIGGVAMVAVAVGEPSLYDDPDSSESPYEAIVFRVRNVVQANVADLTAYTVAASDTNDNVLGVANDVVLLVGQTTAAQNGPYLIGTVAAGVAPLTRVILASGAAFLASGYKALVAAGSLYANSEWKNTAAGTVATDDPAFRPWRVNPMMTIALQARNVLLANVADLASYTVAASNTNDNVLGVEGDIVLALGQTTATQNGVYRIGTVAAGVAPLTRIQGLPSGLVVQASQIRVAVNAGSLYANSEWKNTAAVTLGTTDPAFRAFRQHPSMGLRVQARNILNANVADLAAYTVASNAANNDATLGVEGDIVLAIAQTTAAQNGLYRIGTVAAGVAPLTRIELLPAGAVLQDGQVHVSVSVGTVYSDTDWKNTAAGTVGTNDPVFMPRIVSIKQALVAGTMTITSIPILSATKSQPVITRSTPNTSAATVMYALNGDPTAGALGTASAVFFATIADGTINVADISTLRVAFINW